MKVLFLKTPFMSNSFSSKSKNTIQIKLHFLIASILLLSCSFSFSQENTRIKSPSEKIKTDTLSKTTFEETIILPLQKNQLYFEKVFLHLNKTSYFADDIIWFKAYVSDIKNKPSNQTSRLHVSLLNADGKTIQDQNIFINKGIGKGQFVLNDTLKNGTYYLLASTNYMRNFGVDHSFFQKINIINKLVSKESKGKNNYDVQLFPEGGYLLEGAENVIGLKSLLNGKGHDFSGKIINQKNQEIASFKSEHSGMSKCHFFYDLNENYTALIKTNDTLFKVNLPAAQKNGILLNIDNNNSDILKLIIKTNRSTTSKSNYKILFHQRNQIIDYVEIPDLKTQNTIFEFDKKNFFEGVNTITLFKDNQPIAERKFYKEDIGKTVNLTIEKNNLENDSISYKIKTDKSLQANLSVSVLPINAANYAETITIKSAFLLSPFVKGHIENPGYYFKKDNQKRNEHLDLLLLTQGWTQFSVKEMVTDLNPPYQYDFEAGFKIKGNVFPKPTNQLALMTKDNLIIDKIFLNDKKDFSFNNLLIYKGDHMKISFIKNQNEAIKPENLHLDTVQSSPFFNFKIEKSKTTDSVLNSDLWTELHTSGSIKLDEISITSKNKTYTERKQIIRKYKPLVFDIGKYYNLPIADHFKNKDLMYFLNFDQDTKLVKWNGIETHLETGINKEALLYIDGKHITSNELSSVSLQINEIDNILVQPVRGNKIFQVFTSENYQKDIIELFAEYLVTDGFDREKKYYAPIYDFDENKYSNWFEIDWKPDLVIKNDDETFIKIKQNKQLQGYLFSVQGYTQDGSLISEIITIK
ncbi:MAG: hypothetical protein ABWY22_06120 [Flavobacterium sp.]